MCARIKDRASRHALRLKQEAHLLWTRDRSPVNWEQFVRCQVIDNETYEVKRQFSVRNGDVLRNSHRLLISDGPLLSLLCSA